MVAARTQLTLILPGLSELSAPEALSSSHRLHRLTSRSTECATGSEGYEQALMDALGYSMPGRAGIPGAQCTHLTDFDESAVQDCARADPVYIRAEQDHGRLLSFDALSFDPVDAQLIVEDLNRHFSSDGIDFSIGQRGRWYVSGKPASGLDSAPTSVVAGKNVSSFLPHADEAVAWRQFATEVQMLLHAHPVNEKRTSQGLVPINALWFWGAGKLVPRESLVEYRLFSDAAFALGLGKLSAITAFPLNNIHQALSGDIAKLVAGSAQKRALAASIIVLDTTLLESILTGDQQRQLATLVSLESDLFRQAEQLLLRGAIGRLIIDTCDGRKFELRRSGLLRFWIRTPVLKNNVEHPDFPTLHER